MLENNFNVFFFQNLYKRVKNVEAHEEKELIRRREQWHGKRNWILEKLWWLFSLNPIGEVKHDIFYFNSFLCDSFEDVIVVWIKYWLLFKLKYSCNIYLLMELYTARKYCRTFWDEIIEMHLNGETVL
jgi:hypothetical protein